MRAFENSECRELIKSWGKLDKTQRIPATRSSAFNLDNKSSEKVEIKEDIFENKKFQELASAGATEINEQARGSAPPSDWRFPSNGSPALHPCKLTPVKSACGGL